MWCMERSARTHGGEPDRDAWRAPPAGWASRIRNTALLRFASARFARNITVPTNTSSAHAMFLSPIRRLTAALALAMLTALGSTSPADAQRADLEKIIQRRVLPNGLEVIVVENHGVPLATVEINVKNGSFTQSPEFEGLAHMYEHMIFRANSKYREPSEFLDRMSDLGAVFNGTTQ